MHHQFDERQQLLLLKAYRLAFISLVLQLLIIGILDIWHIQLFNHLIVLAVTTTVISALFVATYLIWHRVWFDLWQSRSKRSKFIVILFFYLMGGFNLTIAAYQLMTYATFADVLDHPQLLFGIFFIIFATNHLLITVFKEGCHAK